VAPIRAKGRALTDGKTFPIVGIGASAGGLEAFTQLLTALPLDTGMAFVLVQHLEAKHESLLARLLSKATQMPVTEVRQGTRVEPNHVYVIPANADLILGDGALRIMRRKTSASPHLPIDHFFRTLAESQGPRAVGVILSGTATDGTLGLKAIKLAGGTTFAQEPRSAKFDGMPKSAILAGCVDFVLRPERIARELSQITLHVRLGRSNPGRTDPDPPVPALEEEWMGIFKLLRETSGVDFTFYKKPTISRRVARRMALKKIKRLSEYVNYLQGNREELNALYQDLLIHVTSFFREPEVFRALRNKILPQILARKPASDPLRIWVAGCSSGEEVYSIAICLLENLGDRAASTAIQIFASDVNEQLVDSARGGVYSKDAVKKVSKERVRRFFDLANGKYQIKPGVRDLCIFARHNLAEDPPFSRMDLISCRNVLIYLEPVLQKRILASFRYALRDGGFLLLGKSETLGGFPDFKISDRKNKFFVKAAATAAYKARPVAFDKATHHEKRSVEEAPGFDLEKEADRVIWEQSRHAGLIVNGDLQILHFRGDTSPYIRPVPGKATFQLLRMLREELVIELRVAINKARKTKTSVKREAVRVKRNGDFHLVNIEVRPLPAHRVGDQYFLILFEEVIPPTERQSKYAVGRRPKEGPDQELTEVRNELTRTRDYLQAIIQEQETTNEGLKAANEEAQSSVEELHSTNEELETAKEELQSGNEELVTLNEQLQKRNTELGYLSDEMSNILTGVDIPILILGGDRRIRRFTPSAEKLLHLLPGDIGHPIGHIRIGVNLPDLDESISQVIKGARDVWREVQTEEGRWYSVRILPFVTSEHKIDGVLMVFVDVDELKQSQQRSQREQELITAILNAAKDLLVIVLDRAGRILQFNRAAQELTGYSLEEVKGRRFWDRLPIPEERAQVKSGFEEVLVARTLQGETHWLTKRGQPRLIAWSNTVVVNDVGAVDYVIWTGVDVTEREEAQLQARDSKAAIHTLREQSEVTLLHKQDELQALTARLLAIQEAGNKDLARELHDDLSQKLAALGMEVSTLLQPSIKSPEVLAERVHALSARINGLAENVHAMSRRLHPAILDELGLEAALKEECVGFSAQAGVRAEFESKGVPLSLPEDVTLCLYRVAQESLRNIAKHARATKVRVVLFDDKGVLCLRIEDIGDGFDLNEIKGKGGLGLISMEERVRLVSGKFTIKSQPGEGTTVEVFVPLRAK
jgi:two-component system, chemotaxis family, CheB/CheR fusion protein